jgi:hypothetical protein
MIFGCLLSVGSCLSSIRTRFETVGCVSTGDGVNSDSMSESTRSESMTLGTEQTWDTNRELSELTPSPVETQPTVSKRVRIENIFFKSEI